MVSQHIEPEAREVYERMIEVFFYAKPLDDLRETVHQEFFGYGTAAHEFFESRKELQKMAQLQAEQLRQQKFEVSRKKVMEKLLADGTSCLIVEEFDLYLSESDHQMQMRLSTILEHMDEKWLVTHFHGSTPDSNIDDTEALPMEGLRKKNVELEARIKARTRDLEIEAALEKVRSRTMAMQNSGELPEAANVLFLEIQALGIPAWSCGYNILADDKKSATCWMSSEGTLQKPFTLRLFGEASFDEMGDFIRSKETFMVQEIGGKALEEHYDHMKSFPDLLPIFEDLQAKGLSLPTYQINHLCKFSHGFLLFITYEPVSRAHDIFKRFTSVFEQTYTRFLDLQKAEAQAREAQIEAALERVRSRSMAMHRSEELAELSLELVKQVQALGVATWFCAFNIYDDDPEGSLEWGSNGQGTFPKYRTPREGIFLRYYEAGQRGETLLINEIGEDECPAHYEYLCTLPGVGEQLLKMKEEGIPFPASQIDHVAFFKYGYVLFITYDPAPESHEIFIRFANVFEQTYTRFLDLQKAEAQAREAQIQLSLERVRARSLAMQSSDELHEVLSILFQQFDKLGIKPVNVFLSLFDREARTLTYRASGKSGTRTPAKQVVDVDNMVPLKALYDKWIHDNSDDVEVIYYSREVLPELFGIFANTFDSMPEEDRIGPVDFPDGGYSIAGYTPFGYLGYDHQRKATEEEKNILSRFCTEFTRVYQRFLDLQRSEAQAREAQIEAAMERIRSRAIAMRSSDELLEVALEIRIQTDLLGQQDLELSVVHLYEKDAPYFESMAAMRNPGSEGEITTHRMKFPVDATPKIEQMMNNYWAGLSQYTIELDLKAREAWQQVLQRTVPEIFDKRLQFDEEAIANDIKEYWNFSDFSGGSLLTVTYSPPTEETQELFRRASDVFDLAYKRYKDLQKAEAQAREAEIEAALERVRSQSLAMHSTSEMQQVANAVFEQLQNLGLEMDAVGMSGVIEENNDYDVWIGGSSFDKPLRIPFNDATQVQRDYNKAIEGRSELFVSTYSGDIKKEYIKHLLDHGSFPEDLKKLMIESDAFTTSISFAKNSSIQIARYNSVPYSDVENEILKRFARVFEQAYIRFLDLQKAETQAREAEIEAALERVRSKTMAMHNSQDVGVTVITLFDEVQKLRLDDSIRCGIGILEGTEKMETWSANATPGGEVDLVVGMLDMSIHPMLVGLKKAWKSGKKGYAFEFKDGDVRTYYSRLNKEPEYPFNADLDTLPDTIFHNSFFYSSGILFAFTENPISEEASKILKRFAGVFGQTYRRYLDLLKAEKQAREAEIEVALERVRSRAMAMHHSDELTDVLGVLFDQFDFLGINPVLTHLTLFDEANETFTLRITTGGKERVIAEQLIDVNAVESWKTSFANWKKSELHTIDFIEYPPEVLPAVWELLDKVMGALPKENKIFPEDFPDGLFTTQGHCKYGYLGFNHTRRATEEEKDIVIRFAKEFGRLYQRFLDIQKAELQAREALKQATLDRIRGQIASMRSTDDLERITPLIWNELTALEIPFIRCGVFIIEESDKTVQAFLSAPDGHSLGAMRIPFDADKDTAATVAHWKKKEVYKTHWDKSQFLEFMQLMMDLGQVSNKSEYQGAEQPPESLHLHFVPFTQGMLYVGNEESLEADEIELVQSLADSFAIAYARYEDFVRLEKAKKQVENTLEELKSTQNQLVQSEKMASLGELTAGIAHEIQNPLNFVNNFSEVSVELLEELQEEMSKGDLEEVKALIEDIQQNLNKINHHGQRADGIVKGMLQHSRAGSGEKELTDLNILADEYLRLAYHGLRAKDKTFNANMETHFDKGLGKVNVVPQDIGRVILNLITNAFYVVKEKGEQQPEGYEPTVTVTTKKKKDKVLLSVKDNGNGIPKKIQDKIFQPFFTTKPTGQGTGLGLSMSYDIVTKGHGGDLKVESVEGTGTTMTISLPIQKISGS